MISDFELYIPGGTASFLVEGKVDELVTSNDKFRVVNNSYRLAVRWVYKGNRILIENTEGGIRGYISLDRKYVLATHYKTAGIEDPRNAVVYNADGSVHLFLEPEKILQKMPDDKRLFYAGRGEMSFGWPDWRKNSKGETVLAIEFFLTYRETVGLEVNPETGEFGELLYRTMEK